MVDWDPVERNSGQSQEQSHSPHCREQDASASESINNHQIDPGKEEIRGSDDRPNCHRIGETDKSEERRRVVHKTVESTELTDSHEATSCDESSEISWDDVKLLNEPELAFAFLDSFGLCDMGGDVADLLLDLLLSPEWENFLDDDCGFVMLVVVDQLTRRFWAEWEKTHEDDGRDSSERDHCSPSVWDLGKCCSNAVRDELSASD